MRINIDRMVKDNELCREVLMKNHIESYLMRIANNIVMYRDKLNMTQKQLAKHSGISRDVICWAESKGEPNANKNPNISLTSLLRICKALNVTLKEITEDEISY